MSDSQIPMLRKMPLPSRLGWMVAAVLVTLMEIMDLVGMLTKPDDTALLVGLKQWGHVHSTVRGLIEGNDTLYWLLRLSVVIIAALGGLFAARFAGRIAASLAEVREAARRVAAGDLETPVQIRGSREVEGLATSIDQMRLALGDVLRLARETAALREDLALGHAAGEFLTPERGWLDQDGGERVVGFHTVRGKAAGFWWHARATHGRRNLVLGYVEGTGPAAVMSLAALAGAVRDELLHVKDVSPRALVMRAHALCRDLTPCPIGLCVVTVDPASGQGQWVAAGAVAPSFAFHEESLVQRADDDVHSGSVSFDDRLAVMLGPRHATDAEATVRQALERAAESDDEAPDLSTLLADDCMPAAVVLVQRMPDARSCAA